MHIYIHTYIHTYVYVYMYTYIHMCIHMCIHIYTCVYICVCICACIKARHQRQTMSHTNIVCVRHASLLPSSFSRVQNHTFTLFLPHLRAPWARSLLLGGLLSFTPLPVSFPLFPWPHVCCARVKQRTSIRPGATTCTTLPLCQVSLDNPPEKHTDANT